MDLRQYRPQPDPGLFDNIQRRLRRRRALRMGGVAAALVVCGVALWVAWPQRQPASQPPLIASAERPAVQPLPAAAPLPEEQQPVADTAATGPQASAVTPPATPDAQPQPADDSRQPQGSPARTSHQERQPLPELAAATPTQPQAPALVLPSLPPATLPAIPDSHPETGSDDIVTSKVLDPSDPVAAIPNLLWAPNIIIPDGEMEENRTFGITFTSPVSDFRIRIFNRGGRQVFQSSNPDFRWDATLQGSRLQQGTYVWVAQFRDSDGVAVQQKGTVTVVR